MANAYQTMILNEPSLLHYYAMEEPGGSGSSSLFDSKGSLTGSYDGTNPKAQLGQTGIPAGGTCCLFTGATGNCNGAQAAQFATGGTGVTLEAWVYLTGAPAALGVIVAHNNAGSVYPAQIYVNTNLTIEAQVTTVVGGQQLFNPGNTLSLNKWHHLVLSAPTGGTANFYLDGVSIGSMSIGTPLSIGTSAFISIGCDYNGGAPVDNGAAMKVDEAAIYNSGLSALDILLHYQLGSTIPTTIEYFDGFDDYNTAQMLRYFAYVVNWTIATGGRNSTNCLYLNTNINNNYAGFVFTAQVTRTVGFAFKVTTIPTGGPSQIFSFNDGGSVQCDLRLNTNGSLFVTRAGTTLGTSASGVIVNATYAYIEYSLTIDGSAGSYTVKVNGTTVLTGSGVNTKATSNSTANGVAFGSISNIGYPGTWFFDDFYSRSDGTFIGDCLVELHLPNANGATNNFTPLTSSNYVEVQDNPSDDDTSYNYSATAGNIDLFSYPALNTGHGAVQAVMPIMIAKVDTVGVATGCLEYRQSSTNYDAVLQNISANTYTAYKDIKAIDPSTGVAWTNSGVNSCQFGVKRVS